MPSRLIRWASVLPLALVLAACSGDFAASLGPGGTTPGNLFALTPDALIGQWTNITTSDGTTGVVTQTTWNFQSGGVATRTITTLTALGAALSTSTAQATWTVSVGTLLLHFGAPAFQILRVPYTIQFGVQTTTLLLNGVPYQRVGTQ